MRLQARPKRRSLSPSQPARSPASDVGADSLSFPRSLDPRERHVRGAHYTCSADIQKVVQPTIVQPWRQRIDATRSLAGLRKLHDELCSFRILDPACGSGNFLAVAFLELRQLEMELLARLDESKRPAARRNRVSVRQCFGIDSDPRAIALARTCLRKLEPQTDLSHNLLCADALFCSWPKANVIIGNPPFQAKNNMQREFGVAYLRRLRARYPGMPGRADYCVYWLRRAHQELSPGDRAGFVATNTISQNDSRVGGLDYIAANGGTLIDVVASQPWKGDAGVHVAMVNWIKGPYPAAKTLVVTKGGLARRYSLATIPNSLTPAPDVTRALSLQVNRASCGCYQGQTHGHAGFLLTEQEARTMLRCSPAYRDVIFPYLTGEELLNRTAATAWRFVIDLHPRTLSEARGYPDALAHVAARVLTARQAAARAEQQRNVLGLQPRTSVAAAARPLSGSPVSQRLNSHHRRFLDQWWLLAYPRPELMATLRTLPRYIVCSRVTTHPIFHFVDARIHPSDVVQVFPFADDYSFGILQSSLHWTWFTAQCSTLGVGPRYTSATVFNTFPWPQQPTPAAIRAVAAAAIALRRCREEWLSAHQAGLRQLYRFAAQDRRHSLHGAQRQLDRAVRKAYDLARITEPLSFLLRVNKAIAERERAGKAVTGPGLPPGVACPKAFRTVDCLRAPSGFSSQECL